MQRTSMRGMMILGAVAVVIFAGVVPASATWSIVMADTETREVAAGTVTCLNNYDLLDLVPVIVVEKGAGAVQAAGDFAGNRRPIIFEGLMDGTSPEDMLATLAMFAGHQSRQIGIVDTQGRMITFTGSLANQWAGGVVGSFGTTVYAIQGNILAGDCVVPAIEDALINTPGDYPDKLLAGMVAARMMGGDGRCSCSPSNPLICGCPPDPFEKSGHIGGIIVARVGDTDDAVCDLYGCADGDYFLRLNVARQQSSAPDPVDQLQDLFDQWRSDHVGRPDATHSVTSLSEAVLLPDGVSTSTLSITLLDWQDMPITAGVDSVLVEHASGSAGIATIGTVQDLGGGSYAVELTSGEVTGVDRYRITVDDGIRPVVLMPEPRLGIYGLGDLNCDGVVNNFDIDAFVAALVDPAGYSDAYPDCSGSLGDVNQDGVLNNFDIDGFVDLLTRA